MPTIEMAPLNNIGYEPPSVMLAESNVIALFTL